MPGTSDSRGADPPLDGAAEESSATLVDPPAESASWMTTNGPLLAFDLVRVPGNAEDADTRTPRP